MTDGEREELTEHFMDALDEAEKQHTPVVPHEAVEAHHDYWTDLRNASHPAWERHEGALAAAAPFIVAANQPKPDGDLREALAKADFLNDMTSTTNPEALWDELDSVDRGYHRDRTAHLAMAVQAYVVANQPDAAEVERLRAQRDAAVSLAEEWRGLGILDLASADLRRALGA